MRSHVLWLSVIRPVDELELLSEAACSASRERELDGLREGPTLDSSRSVTSCA